MSAFSQPVVVRSLVDELVDRLENGIMTGELAGGTLVREQSLAKQLGVSRGPLREAIRRLEGRMLVERTPNVGARIVSLSFEDLREIWVIREALEGIACYHATVNMTNEEIDGLHHIVEMQAKKQHAGEWSQTYKATDEYDLHYRIILGSRNRRLMRVICEDLHYLLRVYRYRLTSKVPSRPYYAVEEHKRIVEAIAKRKPELAEKVMRDHIRRSLDNFMSLANEDGDLAPEASDRADGRERENVASAKRGRSKTAKKPRAKQARGNGTQRAKRRA